MNRPDHLARSALRWLLAGSAALWVAAAHADIKGITGGSPITQTAAATRTFNLFAADGYITAADGVQIYMWGYGAPTADGGTGAMQITGPTLLVNQGDTVVVNFTNTLLTPSSIIFPGQADVTASGGTGSGVLAASEANPSQTVSYQFTAAQPGTYLYQSGTQPGLQNEMGLVGALVVYPTGAGAPAPGAATRWAYNHAGTAYERENLLVVSDVDSDIHQAIADQVEAQRAACNTTAGCVFTADMSKRFPKYWMLNGRTSPDVFAKNFTGELPHQPYNALPRVHPGERVLLRMVGAGSDLHPMHHHGANSWAIARDGRMLSSDPVNKGPNLALSDYTIKVVPGQTYDAVWSWTGKGIGWDIYGATCNAAAPVAFDPNVNPMVDNCRFGKFNASGVQTAPAAVNPATGQAFVTQQDTKTDVYKQMPVRLPSEFELAYGEFYSGSPFLGTFGLRPVGAGVANTTGGFFHMFHSHNEREVVNGGIYPGGMMTMLVVEPLGVSID